MGKLHAHKAITDLTRLQELLLVLHSERDREKRIKPFKYEKRGKKKISSARLFIIVIRAR